MGEGFRGEGLGEERWGWTFFSCGEGRGCGVSAVAVGREARCLACKS